MSGFCSLPFVQYSTYNGGRFRLCCMAKEPKKLVNQEELGIDGTWNHNYIKDVRRRMTAGEKLPECVECHHLERNGIMSSRQWENKVWADVIDDVVAKAQLMIGKLTSLYNLILDLVTYATCSVKCATRKHLT